MQHESTGKSFTFWMLGTFPTATDDDLGGDQWRLGPEVFFGVIRNGELWALSSPISGTWAGATTGLIAL
jgi:hypothetical protein